MRARSLAFVATIVLTLASAAPAFAERYFVNIGLDFPDPTPGDHICGHPRDGARPLCSLRAAIMEANSHLGEVHRIDVQATLNIVGIPGSSEDGAATGDLDIRGDITIVGDGPPTGLCAGRFHGDSPPGCTGDPFVGRRGPTTILALTRDRVFHNLPGSRLLIVGVAIIGGQAPDRLTAPGAGGGGILNEGALALGNVAIVRNGARTGGGGLFNSAHAVAELLRVSILDNTSRDIDILHACGGGIRNDGVMRMDFVEVKGNDVLGDAGGGVCNLSKAGQEELRFDSLIWRRSIRLSAPLEIFDTKMSGNTTDENGGGLAVFAATKVFNTEIVDNRAAFEGGGIFVGPTDRFRWALDLNQTRLTSNHVFGGADPRTGRPNDGNGGGVAVRGILHARDLEVKSNDARKNGGGLWSFGGEVRIAQATFDGNLAGANGGGILAELAGVGFFELVNATITGNRAPRGGGLDVLNLPPSSGFEIALIRSVTFSLNRSVDVDGGANLRLQTGAVVLRNTILAEPLRGTNCRFFAPPVLQGHNLEDLGSCGFPAVDSFVDPRFDALRNNGGFAETIGLLETSPAIDAVAVADCDPDWRHPTLYVDERGVPRPQGSACDAGAFERDPFVPDWVIRSGIPLTELITLGSAIVATSLDVQLAIGQAQDGAFLAAAIVGDARALAKQIDAALHTSDEQLARSLLANTGGALAALQQTIGTAGQCCGDLDTQFSFVVLARKVDAFATLYAATQPPKPIEKP